MRVPIIKLIKFIFLNNLNSQVYDTLKATLKVTIHKPRSKAIITKTEEQFLIEKQSEASFLYEKAESIQ